MANNAIQFTYNAVTKAVIGKHELRVEDGKIFFGGEFLLSASSAANFETASDAMLAAFTVNDKAFSLADGAQTIVSWSPAANTGFLTRARVTRVKSRLNTDLTGLYRFELEGETSPQESTRNGRREATISLLSPNPREIRTIEFAGKWTALPGGSPLSAKDAYDTYVATWIASWLAIVTTTGIWQNHGSPALDWDDENKVLTFRAKYQEVIFSSSPTDTTNAIYTIGKFTRNDPEKYGEPILNANVGTHRLGDVTQASGGTGQAAPGAIGNKIPRRFTVSTTTYYQTPGTYKPNSFFDDIIRPWIRNTVKAIFGNGRVVFERFSVPVEDVAAKSIECQAQVLVASAGVLLEYEETVRRIHNPNLVIEDVWSGQADDFDISAGGRRLNIVHTIRQVRIDQQPSEPSFLSSPWLFIGPEDFPQSRWIIDPVTDSVVAYEFKHERTYLYAPARGGGSSKRPITGHGKRNQ
jgi:hypothetical protein